MNFAKFLRTLFLTEHLWWLLLNIEHILHVQILLKRVQQKVGRNRHVMIVSTVTQRKIVMVNTASGTKALQKWNVIQSHMPCIKLLNLQKIIFLQVHLVATAVIAVSKIFQKGLRFFRILVSQIYEKVL